MATNMVVREDKDFHRVFVVKLYSNVSIDSNIFVDYLAQKLQRRN